MADKPGNDRLITLQTLGKYRVEGVLGKGAMGVVYKGYDTVLERFVALKTIHAHLAEGQERESWLSRFKQEARAAGRCLHPNIVAVFDYGEHQGIPYIAMEYVNGRELSKFLKERKQLNLQEALSIVSQVLTGLGYAHQFSIVHRDIKPGNIILLDSGQVKVADFGIARIESTNITQQGVLIGTPSYMSPEQFRGQEVDLRTDLYSTGVVLYQLLTGEIPYPGKTFTEILYKVASSEMRDVRELNPTVPDSLNNVVQKALAKDPGWRYQSAREFADALQEAMEAMPDTTLVQPVPLPDLGSGSSSWKDSMVSGWEQDVLRKASEALSVYIGPVAKLVVKRAAQEYKDPEQFYQTLARNIPTEVERSEFLRRMKLTSTQTYINPLTSAQRATGYRQALNPQDLEKVQQQLTAYLGPIAKVLVKKTAPQASSLKDLYDRLAGHIPDAAERAIFLAKSPKSF
ncbi:MAG: serine/threonine protein kinase [Gammaproteobacteria bacterium]|nr:serine/threonine protein kinase [Gammaproteobacteria bacterium]MCP5423858.1 serine/threonine protein kinase [Gammaproteobacteria bacterium]